VISHLSLPEAVRLTLRRRILNNELAAGERLIEASLAAEFGVSRTTLRSVDGGDLAEAVECDTRLHSVLIEAGGRARLAELWHALDGQMGALMRSSLEFQGGDLTQVTDRHRSLIAAVATRDRIAIAAALKDHYLNPKMFADAESDQEEEREEAS
jgi:GntR family transcriptional regulator, rspAB operon transcriptional repressor